MTQAARIAPSPNAYQCHQCKEFLFDEQVEQDMPTDAELKQIQKTRGRFRRGGLIECFDKYHLDAQGNRCGPVHPIVCYR